MGILVVRFTLTSLCILNAIILVCCVSSNDTDMHALLAFKAQIKEDPYGAMSSWNESTHFCIWHGVTCSRRHHQRVTMLELPSQNLVGSLSPHVGNLSFLRILNLNNNLSHEIPPGIAHLHRLQVLRLHNNSFSGPIPSNISHCFDLEYVNLGYNKLVGKIPSEIGSFPKLQILVFQHNNLTGEIPPSLGNLSSLEVFAASDNNFTGSIPSFLGQLKKLTFLTLGVNNLSGTFPPSLCNISSLQTLMMQFNQIEGSIPSYSGKYLPNLEAFSIACNQFTGSIPLSISNATSLWMFQVGYNKLTGQVPDLWKLHNLEDFNIQGNRLGSGRDGDLSVLSDLTNARELRKLVMTNNNFGGSLPTSISNLSTKLEFFLVQKNRIDGSIPAGLGNLISMEALTMHKNSLIGKHPY